MGPLNDKSILLIEDDEALLDLIPRVLSQAGFVVTATAAPASAEKLMQENTYNLLVCDLSVIGGEAAFKFLIRVGAANPKLSFLIITGNASENIREQAEFHNVEIMEKPFIPAELVTAATRLFKSRAA